MDPIVTSANLAEPDARKWLGEMHSFNILVNVVTCLTNVKLYEAGDRALEKLRNPELTPHVKLRLHENLRFWNSIWVGVAVIPNRRTPRHRDKDATHSWYDLLFSGGNHTGASLDIEEVGALVCGKLLSHAVNQWEGERLCLAYYMRRMVHDRLGIFEPSWNTRGRYVNLMNKPFARRQGWVS